MASGSGPIGSDLTDPPTNAHPAPGATRRRLYRLETDRRLVECDQAAATLVGSRIADSDDHSPALDLDVPAYLIPSSTPGHSHLYIDVRMSWWRYVVLLWALSLAGVIEPGYFRASVRKGTTCLRRPGVAKLTPEQEEAEAIALINAVAR